MKRAKPVRHIRRLKNGKKILVGHKPTRYTTKVGTFKRMTDPENKSERKSKFYGCERSMISRGYSKDVAARICGGIARKKARNYGAGPNLFS